MPRCGTTCAGAQHHARLGVTLSLELGIGIGIEQYEARAVGSLQWSLPTWADHDNSCHKAEKQYKAS